MLRTQSYSYDECENTKEPSQTASNNCVLAKKYKTDIIGIEEHRIVLTDDSEQLYENLPEEFQLVTASAWRNST